MTRRTGVLLIQGLILASLVSPLFPEIKKVTHNADSDHELVTRLEERQNANIRNVSELTRVVGDIMPRLVRLESTSETNGRILWGILGAVALQAFVTIWRAVEGRTNTKNGGSR